MTTAYSVNDLSDAACFALAYAQALIAGPTSLKWREFAAGQAALTMTGADQRRALAKGLAELRELGLIECVRDGQGDLVPVLLHEERIQAALARLVTGERN